MAFVNEYISEEDMEKYKVIEAWKAFIPNWSERNVVLMGKFAWTVDKERDIFFIPMVSGREEESGQRICALWWKGTLLSVTLDTIRTDLDFANFTGFKVWGLLRIWQPDGSAVPDAEIKAVLKEALTVFQFDGVRHPMKDYPVTFTF